MLFFFNCSCLLNYYLVKIYAEYLASLFSLLFAQVIVVEPHLRHRKWHLERLHHNGCAADTSAQHPCRRLAKGDGGDAPRGMPRTCKRNRAMIRGVITIGARPSFSSSASHFPRSLCLLLGVLMSMFVVRRGSDLTPCGCVDFTHAC